MNSDSDSPETDGLIEALLGHFSGGVAEPGAFEPKLVADLREELERNELLGEDMSRFWAMLKKCVGRCGFTPAEGRPVDLLNLACAHCEEAAVLSAFFSRHGEPVRFFGMDVRAREIDNARRRYEVTEKLFRKMGVPALKGEGTEFEFIADDATRLKGYRQIPEAFDVIFLRHQNVWHDRKIWQRIFEFALDRLGEHGILIITSYFDREHMIALDLFKMLGAEVLVSEKNPDSRELDYPGKSVDRHMAVFRRVSKVTLS